MKKLNLKNFKIIKVISIIGCYDDLKNKSKNFFDVGKKDKVKKFKEFIICLSVEPNNQQEKINKKGNFDIGLLNKKIGVAVDIVPFIKDGDIYYLVKDKSHISLDYIHIFLDDYYEWKDACKIIKDKIKNNYNTGLDLYCDYNNQFLQQLHISNVFNYEFEL